MKFISLSQLLDTPSLGPSLVFSQFQVLLCHLWRLKKKKKVEGRRDIEGEKEGVEEERKKERKKVLNEIKIIKNNYLKKLKKKKEQTKKTSLLSSNWPSQFCWSFWLQPTQRV